MRLKVLWFIFSNSTEVSVYMHVMKSTGNIERRRRLLTTIWEVVVVSPDVRASNYTASSPITSTANITIVLSHTHETSYPAVEEREEEENGMEIQYTSMLVHAHISQSDSEG